MARSSYSDFLSRLIFFYDEKHSYFVNAYFRIIHNIYYIFLYNRRTFSLIIPLKYIPLFFSYLLQDKSFNLILMTRDGDKFLKYTRQTKKGKLKNLASQSDENTIWAAGQIVFLFPNLYSPFLISVLKYLNGLFIQMGLSDIEGWSNSLEEPSKHHS